MIGVEVGVEIHLLYIFRVESLDLVFVGLDTVDAEQYAISVS